MVLSLFLFRVNKLRAAIGRPLNLEEGRKDMRKQAFGMFTMLSLLLVLTTASVNAQSKRSFINIPFSFTVGDKTLPAGEYTIAPIRRDSHNVWQVESRNRDKSVLFTTIPVWDSHHTGRNQPGFQQVRWAVFPFADFDWRRQLRTCVTYAPVGTRISKKRRQARESGPEPYFRRLARAPR